ncbi:phosphate acyltransferase PlsX [Alkalimonas amylolytica]|uniref:Phosphate acyltransferase n=1 Tax=Alkalimonas amylolytica TaxID=152573 RepID=A0A1H4A7I8_ALKAM|nr:phosphate acyltransferase PlsX [Alkalimonas amylolytica]SEA31768.1 phosphate:acyl-[acyl carrier protein] acyltransferase [Alkalimonas amylolytica]
MHLVQPTQIHIALDMMGGDHGPLITLPAAIQAVQEIPNLLLTLCGDAAVLQRELSQAGCGNHPRLRIQPCSQQVSMCEKPSSALRNKRDSSMRVALELVEQGQASACVSAGNTGALIAMAHFVLKMLSGVERPALISTLPSTAAQPVYMLDLGATVNCDADTLFQFAVMGSVMAEEVEGLQAPRLALLNMGEEEIKGTDQIKQAAVLLSECDELNYIGFIEGNDIFSGKADVIICDGFVGNVALKTCEGVAKLIINQIRATLLSSLVGRIVGKVAQPWLKSMVKGVNPDQYNGASLIGLRGIVVKSHGNASKEAFLSAIRQAVREVERQVPAKIKDRLEQVLIGKA